MFPDILNQSRGKILKGSIRSSIDKLPNSKKGHSIGPTY